jgi:transketolase
VVTSQLDLDRTDQVQEVRDRAALVRRETIRLVGIAKSGHYSSVFSCAEILGALYSGVMRIAEDPEWPERDRLILSKGHVADGLSIATGMAKAARLRGYDETRIWVLLGDQELNEGQVWEAAGSAAHLGLGNVCAIVDANQMGLDGTTEETNSVEPIGGRFEAFGWDVVELDGQDPEAILAQAAALPPATSDKPLCIVARTVKGKGVSYMELSRTWHLGYLAPDDAAAAVAEIDRRG